MPYLFALAAVIVLSQTLSEVRNLNQSDESEREKVALAARRFLLSTGLAARITAQDLRPLAEGSLRLAPMWEKLCTGRGSLRLEEERFFPLFEGSLTAFECSSLVSRAGRFDDEYHMSVSVTSQDDAHGVLLMEIWCEDQDGLMGSIAELARLITEEGVGVQVSGHKIWKTWELGPSRVREEP